MSDLKINVVGDQIVFKLTPANEHQQPNREAAVVSDRDETYVTSNHERAIYMQHLCEEENNLENALKEVRKRKSDLSLSEDSKIRVHQIISKKHT